MRCGLILSEDQLSEASEHVRKHKKETYCISKLNQAVTEACKPIFKSIPGSFPIYHTLFSCSARTRFRVMASRYGTSRSHSDTPHSVGLLQTSDQLDAETAIWQHTTHIRDRERDIHAPDGIRTRNSSKRAAADSRRRPSGHRHRLVVLYKTNELYKRGLTTEDRNGHIDSTVK